MTALWSHIVGNWQVAWIGLAQPGLPMTHPDRYVYGNPELSSGQSLGKWFDTSPSIWVQRPPDTIRVSQFRSPDIRRHTAPQFDLTLTREFVTREGHRLQFKVSGFNVSNTPLFNFPNTTPASHILGVVPPAQINNPRSVELGFRYFL